MAGKSRKPSRFPSSWIWAVLLFILMLGITYTFFGTSPSGFVQTVGNWASSTSSTSSKILLRMSSTRLNSAHQEEVVEENRAIISFKDSQVFVSCPPCNTSSQGLHKARGIPGLQIPSSNPRADLSILLAVFTDPSKFELRSLLRLVYSVQTTAAANVNVLFALRKPKTEEEKIFVALEMRQFNDILVIDTEDVTKATYKFLSKICTESNLRHDFVMKLEDDSYVRVPNLAGSLADQPRDDLYYGYVLPCENQDAYKGYMAGMGYVLSWDLVEWIGNSSTVRESKAEGHEDKLIGEWLNEGGKAKNRVNKKPLFYDHPEHGGACAREFTQESILVHQVTTTKRWTDLIAFFEPDLPLANSL